MNKLIFSPIVFLVASLCNATEWVEASGTIDAPPEEASYGPYHTESAGFIGQVSHGAITQPYDISDSRNTASLSGNPGWLTALQTLGFGNRQSSTYSNFWNGQIYQGTVSRVGYDNTNLGWTEKKTTKTPGTSDPTEPTEPTTE